MLHTHLSTHTHTHTRVHAHAHTHTHTHTHTAHTHTHTIRARTHINTHAFWRIASHTAQHHAMPQTATPHDLRTPTLSAPHAPIGWIHHAHCPCCQQPRQCEGVACGVSEWGRATNNLARAGCGACGGHGGSVCGQPIDTTMCHRGPVWFGMFACACAMPTQFSPAVADVVAVGASTFT